MSKLLRYYAQGQTYFVTSVTNKRLPILLAYPDLVNSFLENLLNRSNSIIHAWVFLPDHLHMIIDPGETNLSVALKRAKLAFAYAYRDRKGMYKGSVWQPRFWDHIIRDELDYSNHLNYIHYNSVKHGLAGAPREWPHSSFSKYLRGGQYEEEWGEKIGPRFEGSFGE